MARVTVEDCIEKTSSRFELVMIASQRARKIGTGASLTVDRDNDKNPVIALREIAKETIPVEDLKEELVKAHQRMIVNDEDDDVIDLMDGEEEWEKMTQIADGSDLSASSGSSLYGDEDVADDEDKSPLEDLAGSAE